MALHLPKPRSKKPVQQAVGLDGLKVSVSNAATSGVEKSKTVKTGGLAGLTSKVSVAQVRKEIGNEGLRQAAIDAGRKPPSDRTLRRWAQQGRVPHADVAERAQRRAAIERLGGIGEVGCSRCCCAARERPRLRSRRRSWSRRRMPGARPSRRLGPRSVFLAAMRADDGRW